jgi:hypothetical protein
MTPAFIPRADPYCDLDVVDSRAPRTVQATVGVLSAVAVVTGFWPLLGLLAAQLAIGLRFGRQYCLPCLAYYELIQPRFGEGPIEDSRPPRFANMVGVAVLSAATIAYAAGLTTLGIGLGLLVTGLALLAATTGLCVGCELYKIGAWLRGIQTRHLDRLELTDVGGTVPAGEMVVAFSHPLCTGCRELIEGLEADGTPHLTVDVRARPDLARKYGIAVVPTALTVLPDGTVTARLTG